MSIDEVDQRHIDAFFDYVSQIDASKQEAGFGYLAIREGDTFCLCRGRLLLNQGPVSTQEIETSNVRAGYVRLADIGLDAQGVLDKLLEGEIRTPLGFLKFPGSRNGSYSARYHPILPAGQDLSLRISVLKLFGADKIGDLYRQDFDWELKAHALPYDSIEDAASSFNVGQVGVERQSVEFLAAPIIRVNYDWRYEDGAVVIELRLLPNADQQKASFTYRIFRERRVENRGIVEADAIKWQIIKDGVQSGTLRIPAAPEAQLHGNACYAGIAQHFGWIVDPSIVANPRGAAFSAYDPEFSQLKEFLARTGRGNNARDFEAGVAWLLWMLGFGTAYLGNAGPLQDGPDIIATSAAGHMAVIECTTGILKAESKLALVIDRTEAIKRRLQDMGTPNPRLLPVLFTSKSRDDVRAELPDAVKHGVYVVTKESLEDLIGEMRRYPNSDQIYERAEKALRDAQAAQMSAASTAAAVWGS